MKNFLTMIILLLSGIITAQTVTYIKQTEEHITIGNSSIERDIYTVPGKIGTVKIINKLSGTTYVTQSDEFELGIIFSGCGPAFGKVQNGENISLLHINDFELVGFDKQDLADDTKRLSIKLKYNGYQTSFLASVNYEITPANFIRKWVEVQDTSFGIHLLDNIQVECFRLYTKHPYSHGDFGQPIFIDNIFLGVEYPSVENFIANSLFKSGYLVGEKITNKKIVSHCSVLGVSKSRDRLEDAFLSYIDKIKVNGNRTYLLYNSWYDFRNRLMAEDKESIMNEANVLKRIETFDRDMTKKYGITLDAFVLDDGWDKYKGIWEIDSTEFPHTFNPFLKPLNKTNTSLGLWVSPFCGYSNRELRVAYGQRNGYERTGDFLCFAGTKYKEEFKRKMVEYAAKYNLGYFKWDGLLLACNETDHGHPTGLYSREAMISTYLEMMQEVRKVKPDIFINITIGSWLSPWWLKYADCVWMQGEDYAYAENVPSMNLRDKAITYRDAVLWDNFQKHNFLFPVSSLMTHGIIKGRLNFLGGKDESLTSFSNEVMMYFGRGIMMWELYVSPDLLSAGEWNAIASSVKWAKENKDILSKTKMILGEPLRREAYGYIHMTREKGLLLLRNPDVNGQNIKFKLTSKLGDMDPEKEYYVKLVYPYNYIFPQKVKLNSELNLALNSYEVLTAEIIPADKVISSLPIDIRYEKTDNGLKLFGEEGDSKDVLFTHVKRTEKVNFPGNKKEIQFQELSPLTKADSIQSVKIRITVPEGFENTKLSFLLEPDARWSVIDSAPGIKLTVNGINTPSEMQQEKGKWAWTIVPLGQGESIVEYKISSTGMLKGKLGIWIFADQSFIGVNVKDKSSADNELLPSKPFSAGIKKVSKQLSSYKIL